MTGTQLKNTILQEAIEGRLVPQDPNDEPASVLLQRIREEKERLVKEGKLKKKDLVETPISEDEKPFEIPESWEWVRFFSVYNLETNLVSPQQYLSYNHVAPDNIEKGTGRLLHCNTVKEDKVKSNNHLFYEGQIVYSKIRPLLRKAIIAPFDGLCSADMYPLSTEMYSKYALLYLLSDTFNKQVSAICSSRVKMPKINQNELSTILVPLPPLAEQQRIVAKIEELLPKVEEYGKAQEALNKLNEELPERLKKSVLQEAITGRLVPQDPNDEPASVLLQRIRAEKEQLVKEGKLKKKDLVETPISEEEKPFEIPESWKIARLSLITSLIDGEKREGNYVILDAKYLRGKSTGDKLTKGKYVKEGDNIILVDGENSGEVFTVPCEGYMGSTFKQLWVSVNIYLPYVLYFIRYYKDILRNSKKGAAIPHLNKDIFYNLIIGIPPLAEQKRIVAKIKEVFKEIDKLNQ